MPRPCVSRQAVGHHTDRLDLSGEGPAGPSYVTGGPATVQEFPPRSRHRNVGVIRAADDRTMDDVITPARDGRRLSLESRRTLGLAELLERRPELRGVGRWGEDITELALWSA